MRYPLADYPSTARAIAEGSAFVTGVDLSGSDPAEVKVLHKLGWSRAESGRAGRRNGESSRRLLAALRGRTRAAALRPPAGRGHRAHAAADVSGTEALGLEQGGVGRGNELMSCARVGIAGGRAPAERNVGAELASNPAAGGVGETLRLGERGGGRRDREDSSPPKRVTSDARNPRRQGPVAHAEDRIGAGDADRAQHGGAVLSRGNDGERPGQGQVEADRMMSRKEA